MDSSLDYIKAQKYYQQIACNIQPLYGPIPFKGRLQREALTFRRKSLRHQVRFVALMAWGAWIVRLGLPLGTKGRASGILRRYFNPQAPCTFYSCFQKLGVLFGVCPSNKSPLIWGLYSSPLIDGNSLLPPSHVMVALSRPMCRL